MKETKKKVVNIQEYKEKRKQKVGTAAAQATGEVQPVVCGAGREH